MSHLLRLYRLMRFQALILLLHFVFALFAKALPQHSDSWLESALPLDSFTVASTAFSDGAPDLSNPAAFINRGPNDRTSIDTDPNAVSLFNSDTQSNLWPDSSTLGLPTLQGSSIDPGNSVELAQKPAVGGKAVDERLYMCCFPAKGKHGVIGKSCDDSESAG